MDASKHSSDKAGSPEADRVEVQLKGEHHWYCLERGSKALACRRQSQEKK